MAQGSTNFSEYPAGSPPADWTPSVGNSVLNIVTDVTAPGGKRFDISSTGRNCCVYWNSLSAQPDIENVETLAMLADLSGFASYYDGDGLRASQQMGYPWNGYLAALTKEGGPGVTGLCLYKEGGTAETQPGTLPTTEQRWWIRLRVNRAASYVKAWWWLDGDTPKINTDPPDLEFTSETTWMPIAYSGIETDGPGHVLSAYYFSYNTGGGAAPLPGGSSTAQPPVADTVMDAPDPKAATGAVAKPAVSDTALVSYDPKVIVSATAPFRPFPIPSFAPTIHPASAHRRHRAVTTG